jgi:CTD small phosphatase-like protein 2
MRVTEPVVLLTSTEEDQDTEPQSPDNFPPYSAPQFTGTVLLPLKTRRSPRLTVVLDLDETLIHAELMHKQGFDDVIELDNGSSSLAVYVGRRPYLMEFLTQAADLFEIVAFTASHSSYADQVMNRIDPDRRFLRYRLSRDACVMHSSSSSFSGLSSPRDQSVYVKDLRCLGRDMRHVVIVDNNPASFMFQPYNGIPITSWFGDQDDRELLNLQEFLIQLSRAEDVRPVLKAFYNSD